MKKLGTTILLTSILLCLADFAQVNLAQEEESARLLREFAEIKVQDVSKLLNQKEREEMIRLFAKSYIKIARQKHSDYIHAKSPIYVLLKNNFPSLKEREDERGISLGKVIRYLNSNPENREIINSVLIKQSGQKCS